VSRSWDGAWLLTIRCPYCSKLHTHGGGDAEQPPSFGVRVSHCLDGNQGPYDIRAEAA
jgi:hypothetical protein